MKSFLTIFGLLAASCWMGACAGGLCASDGSGKPVVLKEEDGGKWVRVRLGAPLSIELASNPTTGFLWKIATIDNTMIRPDGEEIYIPDRVPPGIVGSGGKTIFPLRLLRPGRTEIVFEYRRPFEKKPEPEKRTIFLLEIDPSG
ncbi:MAG: protease inhibitor I42 family protein [Thermodesulfobacteriota bacterium]